MVWKLNLRFVFTFAWFYGFRTISRGPSYLIANISTPLTLLFLVFMLSHGELVKYAIAGGFLTVIASVALQSSGDAAFMRIQLRIQELFVATSVSSSDYMVGLTMSELVFSSPGIILYAALGIIFHVFTPVGVLVIIATMILLLVATSGLSFIISSSIAHVRNIWGIAGILSIVMTIIPPTFYPYTYLPGWLQYVLSLSPVTPAAILVQGYLGLSPVQPVMWLILLLDVFAYFTVAKVVTKWREN